jgi:hypothetical protein
LNHLRASRRRIPFHRNQPTTPSSGLPNGQADQSKDEEKQHDCIDIATQVRRRCHGDRGYACSQKVGDGGR